MKEHGREILGAYHALPRSEEVLNVRKFLETYAVSLPAIIQAFPKSNLDIDALEAHTWDRLRSFYRYEHFEAVNVEDPREIAFINKAISAIEEWFYNGGWTLCLTTPSDEEIQTLLSHERNTLLRRARNPENEAVQPNLGRERGMPNIYDDVASGMSPGDVYQSHAFKLLQGPAAVINTLTKISTQREINGHRNTFEAFIQRVQKFADDKFKAWGYGPYSKYREILKGSQNSLNTQSEVLKRCRRTLFFMKTSLEGAEMMRRTGHETLTKEDFEAVVVWIEATQAEQRAQRHSNDYIPFSFAEDPRFQGSFMHVNAHELPLALMAVEYLRANKRV